MIRLRNLYSLSGYGDFSGDFLVVREFLMSFQEDSKSPLCFPWGRWEWMFSLPFLDDKYLDRITVWEEDEKIVALLTYESKFGEVYYVVKKEYSYLKDEILSHALLHFRDESEKIRFLIPNSDEVMKLIASRQEMISTEDGEDDAILDLQKNLEYTLPPKYQVTSMKDTYDLVKYHHVLWRGFNHEGEPDNSEENLENRRISLSGPHVDLNRNIAVVEPDGMFVSYCGT